MLGISLSTKDEPAFFRALVRLGSVLGGLPAAVLAKGAASMVKRIPVSADRQAELREDFRKNVPRHLQRGLREYIRGLAGTIVPPSGCGRLAFRRGSFTPRRATVG